MTKYFILLNIIREPFFWYKNTKEILWKEEALEDVFRLIRLNERINDMSIPYSIMFSDKQDIKVKINF